MNGEQNQHDELIRRANQDRQPFEPEVTLFLNDSAESQKARMLLECSGEKFRAVQANGPRIPAAVFGRASYDGLSGIHELVDELAAFRRAVHEAYDRHVAPQVKRTSWVTRFHFIEKPSDLAAHLRVVLTRR